MTAKSIRWLGDIHRCFSARAKALPPKPNMAENPKRRNLPVVLKVQTSTGCMCPWMLHWILVSQQVSRARCQNGKHRRAYLFTQRRRRKCQATLYHNILFSLPLSLPTTTAIAIYNFFSYQGKRHKVVNFAAYCYFKQNMAKEVKLKYMCRVNSDLTDLHLLELTCFTSVEIIKGLVEVHWLKIFFLCFFFLLITSPRVLVVKQQYLIYLISMHGFSWPGYKIVILNIIVLFSIKIIIKLHLLLFIAPVFWKDQQSK